jgi:uncharacterized protein (DUF924 family)
MNDIPSIRDILDFWFLPLGDPGHGRPRDIWWESTPEFDGEIASRFGATIDRAVAGDLHGWTESPEGTLALILVCDQFPRNCFRRTARAFCGDAKALDAARGAIARFYPSVFNPTMRLFFYMPFGHSEQAADQELACALFASIGGEQNMKSAIEHRDVISRFGRFPHRNEVLGRISTADELEYLKNANRYGQ